MSESPNHTPFLHHALHLVARREIGAFGHIGALCHHTVDLPPRLISALFRLRRDGYVQLTAPHRTRAEAWMPAELTLRGIQLLDHWRRTQQADRPMGDLSTQARPTSVRR